MSSLTRETRETRVRVELDGLRATGRGRTSSSREPGPGTAIATDDAFLTHMLVTLAKYARLPLTLEASGDLRHHLIEDVAITLGSVLGRDTPPTCARYGDAIIPMDDALVQVVLDAGGRPHFEGELPSDLYEHFFRSLALNADWTVHVRVIRGADRHHIVEAAFKALGVAIRQALADDGHVFSTKGAVDVEWDEDLDEAAELGAAPDRGDGAAEPGAEPQSAGGAREPADTSGGAEADRAESG